MISTQLINLAKLICFGGSIDHHRLNILADKLGFKVGVYPFNYLGIPISKGGPKINYMQPIVEKIKSKLDSFEDFSSLSCWKS